MKTHAEILSDAAALVVQQHRNTPTIEVKETFVSSVGDRTWVVLIGGEYAGGVIDHYGYASQGKTYVHGDEDKPYQFAWSLTQEVSGYDYRYETTLQRAVARVLLGEWETCDHAGCNKPVFPNFDSMFCKEHQEYEE